MILGRWRNSSGGPKGAPSKVDARAMPWMSGILSNHDIGYKTGLRCKPHGQDWDPEAHAPPSVGQTLIDAINRYTVGMPLARSEFPEAAAVWDEVSFSRAGDIFPIGGFFCVRGKLAEVLAQFDLGDGGLLPLPMFQRDLVTPIPGEHYFLNFGAIKNSLIPERCEEATRFFIEKDSGQQVWHINRYNADARVTLSPEALQGPDLWFERSVHEKIFFSAALGQAIIGIGMADVFRMTPCTID